jgi:hypothetical protein
MGDGASGLLFQGGHAVQVIP